MAVSGLKPASMKERPRGACGLWCFAGAEHRWKEIGRGCLPGFPHSSHLPLSGRIGPLSSGTLGLFIFLGLAWYKVSLSFSSSKKKKKMTAGKGWPAFGKCPVYTLLHFSASFPYPRLLTEKKSKLPLCSHQRQHLDSHSFIHSTSTNWAPTKCQALF